MFVIRACGCWVDTLHVARRGFGESLWKICLFLSIQRGKIRATL